MCIVVHKPVYLPMMYSILTRKTTVSVYLFLLILLPYSIADGFSTSQPIESSSDDADSLLQQGGDHGFSLLLAETENRAAGVDNCGDHSSVPADADITSSSRKKRSALPFSQKKREEARAGKSRVCNWQEKKGTTTPGTRIPSPETPPTEAGQQQGSDDTSLEPKGIGLDTDQDSWPSQNDLKSPFDRFVGTVNEQLCPGLDNVPVCYYPFPSSARFPFLVGSRSVRRFKELTPCRACKGPFCCFLIFFSPLSPP